jgi:hypothetical protein
MSNLIGLGATMYHNGKRGLVLEDNVGMTLSTYTADGNTGVIENACSGVCVGRDGKNLITAQAQGLNDIKQRTLNVPFDVTAGFSATTHPISITNVYSIRFSWEGDKFYMQQDSGATELIRQYACPIPWDLTGMTADGSFNLVGKAGGSARGLSFHPDGTFWWTTDATTIYEFSMSTPWDITTSVATRNSTATRTLESGCFVTSDGLRMVMAGGNDIRAWHMSTPFDISQITGDYDSAKFNVDPNSNMRDIFILGDKLYTADETDDRVYQYVSSA